VMTSITYLIRLQSDLNEHVKGEYEFRNAWNGTRIITNEMGKSVAPGAAASATTGNSEDTS
jgi:hypothetical protein